MMIVQVCLKRILIIVLQILCAKNQKFKFIHFFLLNWVKNSLILYIFVHLINQNDML